MADDTAAVTDSVCPWCSSPLPAADAETCPNCGAHLVPDTDAQVPGVTAIDPEAIVRAAHQPTPQRRNRLLSWISGEYEVEDAPLAPGSVAPPDPDVRREMLRLELEAEVANLQAEAGMALAEAEAEAEAEVLDEGTALAAAGSTDAPAGSVDALAAAHEGIGATAAAPEPAAAPDGGSPERAPDVPEADRA